MKEKIAMALAVILPCGLNASSLEHSPRLKGALDMEIGGAGGYVITPPTTIKTVPILEMGIGWDMNMECGKFDPKISVSNQLNGITEGFKDMMGSIIMAAQSAVASLPALVIQRANPGLYDLLQQGILQGKIDFEYAETSCEEMSRVLMGEQSFPFEKYKLAIKSTHWSQEINSSSTGGDAVKAKDNIDNTNHGNAGTDWTCGSVKGGIGQEPIRALTDVVGVGYNIMFDRTDSCATSAISSGTGAGNPLWEYWHGPLEAANWSKRVLGDIEIRTCDGCKKMKGVPGKGLTYMHRDLADDLEKELADLVHDVQPLTWDNLIKVSAPPGVLVNDILIMSIRKKSPFVQAELIRKLAEEIAYARLVEQGRLLAQMMTAGVKEPNVAAMDQAEEIVNRSIDNLKRELDLLDQEIKTRQLIAKNTIQKILGYEEKQTQSTPLPSRGKTVGTDVFGTP